MTMKRKKLKGTVAKLIKSPHAPEKVQIAVHEADDLYREIRVENTVADEKGEKAALKEGSEVDVIIDAPPDAQQPKP
jgi:hypothetical protein